MYCCTCSGLSPPNSVRRKHPWDEEEELAGDQLKYLSEEGMQQSWKEGVQLGEKRATEDGMRPRGGHRTYPEWWSKPYLADRKARGGQGHSEEELVRQEEADGPDADDTDEDNDDSEGDDDEDEGIPRQCAEDAALLVMQQQGGDESISQFLDHTPQGRMHKSTLMSKLNDGEEKLSADRVVRIQQCHGRDRNAIAAAAAFNPREDDWLMGLGSDIAVQFENNKWVGKVVRMRRWTGSRRDGECNCGECGVPKGKGSWVEYQRPVILHEDRKQVGNVHFQCSWYSRTNRDNNNKKFQLGVVRDEDAGQYHVTTVICPVNMTYVPEDNNYILSADTQTVINQACGEIVNW